MKKLILAIATIISIFALSANASAATTTVDLSRYASETLAETFTAENISYDFSNSNYNDSNNVVTLYVFRKDSCTNCKNFYNFIKDTLLPNYADKFRVVSYELQNNPTNFTLLNQIADAYGQKPADGTYTTPIVIVGNTMSAGPVNTNRQQEIINLINSSTTTDEVIDSSSIRTNMKTSFTDSNFTLTTTDRYYPNHSLSVLPTDASNLTLNGYEYISAHDITLMNNAVNVPLKNTNLTLSIPVNKTYTSYKIAYIENGQIAEVIDAKYQNGFVTFNTSHLSEYAIYGSNTEILTPTETTETNASTITKKTIPTTPNGGVQSTNAISTNVSTLILLLGISGIVFTYRQNRTKRD